MSRTVGLRYLDSDLLVGGVVVAAVVVRLRHDVANAEDRTQRIVVAVVVAAAKIFLVVMRQNVSPKHTHGHTRWCTTRTERAVGLYEMHPN